LSTGEMKMLVSLAISRFPPKNRTHQSSAATSRV
jgi:hypothetical protein